MTPNIQAVQPHSTPHEDGIATEDIRNEFGLILIRKGQRINPALARKLQKQKLDEQLDQHDISDDIFSHDELFEGFKLVVAHYPQLQAIEAEHDPGKRFLRTVCRSSNLPKFLKQALRKLKDSLPETFQRALLGAWLVMHIARIGKWSSDRIDLCFIAALFRDISYLYIDPEATKADPPTQEQWQILRTHPLVSKKLLEKILPDISLIAQAVAEHHEHPAGIGYPCAKPASQCSSEGQLLALADLLCENYVIAHQLDRCSAYLQITASVYQSTLHSFAHQLIHQTHFPDIQAQENALPDTFGQCIIERLVCIGCVFSVLVSIEKNIQALQLDKKGQVFFQRVDQAIMLLHSTGLDSLNTVSLMAELAEEGNTTELMGTQLLIEEFVAITKHIYRLGVTWLSNTPPKTIPTSNREQIKIFLGQLQDAIRNCQDH